MAASWRRDGPSPAKSRALVLFAHGAGAPLTSDFMEAAAAGLAARGFAVVRFHFPYMERIVNGEGRRPPDRAPVLLDAWRAMIDRALKWPDSKRLVLAGKSLGARMASMLLAEGRAPEAKAGVWFGYPLHPAGRPERLRDAHLPNVAVPQLFVQGDRDPLCDLGRLRESLARVPAARLFTVPGGDHSLATSRKAPRSGADLWLDAAADFLGGLR